MSNLSGISVLIDRAGTKHWRVSGERLTRCGLESQIGWLSHPLVALNDDATCPKCIRVDKHGSL